MKETLNALALKPMVWIHLNTARFADKLKKEDGASTVEYALVLAVVVAGIIGAASVIYDPLKTVFEGIVDKIKGIAGV
jgi:Flp pilus assembly pilin Flp